MTDRTDRSNRNETGRAVGVALGTLVLVVGVVLGVGHATGDDPAPAAVAAPTGAAPAAATTEADDGHTDDAHNHAADGHTDDGHTDDGHSDDGHSHGPHGESDVTYDQLPRETRSQVDVTRSIARRYPTAAEAKADGWVKATYSLEGIGAHYLKGGVAGFGRNDGIFDVNDPEILLFDGEGDDAPLAGISYLVSGEDPEGFVGDHDVWHRHSGVCFKGIVIAEIDGHEGSTISMTEAQCREAGGLVFPIGNLTMLHVWVGEGYEAGVPIFAHDHPKLYHDTPLGQPASV